MQRTCLHVFLTLFGSQTAGRGVCCPFSSVSQKPGEGAKPQAPAKGASEPSDGTTRAPAATGETPAGWLRACEELAAAVWVRLHRVTRFSTAAVHIRRAFPPVICCCSGQRCRQANPRTNAAGRLGSWRCSAQRWALLPSFDTTWKRLRFTTCIPAAGRQSLHQLNRHIRPYRSTQAAGRASTIRLLHPWCGG